MSAKLFQLVVFDKLFARGLGFVAVLEIDVVNRAVGGAHQHRRRKSALIGKRGFLQRLFDVFFYLFRLLFVGVDIFNKFSVQLNRPEIEVRKRVGSVSREIAYLDAAAADIDQKRPVQRLITLVGDEIAIGFPFAVQQVDVDARAFFKLLGDPFEIFKIPHGRGRDDIALDHPRLAADFLHFLEVFRQPLHAALGEIFPLHIVQDRYVFPFSQQHVKRLFALRHQQGNTAGTDIYNRVFHKPFSFSLQIQSADSPKLIPTAFAALTSWWVGGTLLVFPAMSAREL